MKRILFTVLLSISILSTYAQVQLGGDSLIVDYGNPKQFVIGGVLVTGTQYLDEGVLINLSGLVVGDTIEIPGDKTTKAITNLWKQGLFSDVKVVSTRTLGQTIFLELRLQERPRLSKFSFKGVSKSEADKIREKIKLERDKVVTENVIAATQNTVKNFYIDKGYLNSVVTIHEIKDTSYANREILEIVVDKKSKVKIHRIYIDGNTAFKDGKLKRAMKDTKEKRWYKIFTSSKFLDEKYQEDKTKLIAKYADKGYRDAAIVFDTVYAHDDRTLDIRIKVDEGHQYFFREITWVGNTKHTSQELNSILGIKKGDIYDQSILDQRLFMSQNSRDVSSLYMDDGYLFFSVTPVEINVESDSIDLEMRIYEGKQARINKVTVVGNTKTNDRVIMREIRTKPGQLFSRENIIRTQRELAQLGYFDQEKLGVNPKPNPADGTVDIEYTVEEKPSDQLELSGGYGANQLVGTLGLSFNNFSARNTFRKGAWRPLPSGDGQRLSLRGQTNGKYYQSYNVSFTEPYLGGKKPNSFSISVFHSIQSNGYSKENPLRQSITITGASVGLGKRLKKPDDFFSIYHEINYQYYVLKNYGSTFLFSDGVANNLSFQETISRNSIDAPIYPRSGSQLSLTAQFTPPYSLFSKKNFKTASDNEKYKFIEYHKWKFSSLWFTRIAGNLVLHTKIQYGFLGLYNRDIGASPFERFYVGGDGLSGYALDGREIIALRGYINNSLSPKNAYGNNIGGTIFDKYTLELRYPLSLNPSATIYILGFAEGGNSWLKFNEFNPFSAKRSLGGGIRIFLPVFGLLGLDWGYGFDKIPNDPNANGPQFHFSIGQQF
ncbi:MAG: outer membrane protein assembly factor BamA [Bacteroidetes bacterium]|nr:outer membrane protein assembly factor BamA [Bacteroidota bacterium]MBK9541404.1 outer membrane protein assembly factor BamA [Bacteroidota bacterium]MBL0258720.1 outer membrane protein assembly factor BamA [Bacteroidota bacterium]MBP6402577.1 outer membrane protein assembly factor BamA [Bacteroidia bacterium]MBP6649056.1 outer membrane protein assembly factor BamA [Bacteroidia bacterium]